jgi:hypothetical protein
MRPRVCMGGIENRLPWQLEIIFDADRCRTTKDFSPLTLAIARPMVLHMHRRHTSILSLKRNRPKASVNATSGLSCLLINDLGFCRGFSVARSLTPPGPYPKRHLVPSSAMEDSRVGLFGPGTSHLIDRSIARKSECPAAVN